MEAALALGGVVLGGLVAWLGSLHGARREADREHERWLRQHRFEAWAELLGIATQVSMLTREDIEPAWHGPSTSELAADVAEKIQTAVALEHAKASLATTDRAVQLIDAVSMVGSTIEGLGPTSFLPHARNLRGAITVTLDASDTDTYEAAVDELDEQRTRFGQALRAQLKAD